MPRELEGPLKIVHRCPTLGCPGATSTYAPGQPIPTPISTACPLCGNEQCSLSLVGAGRQPRFNSEVELVNMLGNTVKEASSAIVMFSTARYAPELAWISSLVAAAALAVNLGVPRERIMATLDAAITLMVLQREGTLDS